MYKYFQSVIDRPTSSLSVLAILPALFLSGCDAEPAPVVPGQSEGRPVRVVEVRSQAPAARLRLPGETRPAERAQVAFLSSGYLAERKVTRGQTVNAGDVLAVLDNPDLAPAVAAAEARVRELGARVRQMEKELERSADLNRRGLVATNDFDRVQTDHDTAIEALGQAEAELRRTRRQLAETRLKAPTDGVVAELLVEPGDFVTAGQPVLALQGNGALEVAVALPERAAAAMKPGDPVQVIAYQSGQTVTGRLRELGRAGSGRPAPAVISLGAGGAAAWFPGQAVYVHVEWAESDVLMVPLAALSDPGTGQARVFRIDVHYARAVAVQTGRLHDGWVEVHGDLGVGDAVITAGQASLLDGEKVRVLR